MYRGTLQSIILQILAMEQKSYGYQLTQKAKEITDGDLQITEGALYPVLHKLELEGLIQSEIKYINGRERKYYSLTEKGCLQKQISTKEMLDFILNLKKLFNYG